MSMRIVIMAIMLALVGERAFSQQLVRSYELAAHCKTVDSFCEAYLGGYIDAAELYQLWITTQRTPLPDNKPSFCPASVGLNKFAESYVGYIEANPAKLDVPSATTLLEMLTTDYRCPTQYVPLR
jgi:hypothetical protein